MAMALRICITNDPPMTQYPYSKFSIYKHNESIYAQGSYLLCVWASNTWLILYQQPTSLGYLLAPEKTLFHPHIVTLRCLTYTEKIWITGSYYVHFIHHNAYYFYYYYCCMSWLKWIDLLISRLTSAGEANVPHVSLISLHTLNTTRSSLPF